MKQLIAALGLLIGLFIGLAQVILKTAWVTMLAGFRSGREMILSSDEATIAAARASFPGRRLVLAFQDRKSVV